MTISGINLANPRKRSFENINEQPEQRAQKIFAASQEFLVEWPTIQPRNIEATVPFLTQEAIFPEIGNETTNHSDLQFHLCLKQIDSFIQSKNFHEAYIQCMKLISFERENREKLALLYLRAAYCHNATDRFENAKQCCEFALQLTKNTETIAFIKMREAFALYGLNEKKASLDAYNQAISYLQTEPRYTSSLYVLYIERSRLYDQMEQKEEAQRDYQLAQMIKNQVRLPNASALPSEKPFIPIYQDRKLDYSEFNGKCPNLYSFPYLKQLILTLCNFTETPDCRGNALLEELDLSLNKITVPPDLTENPELKRICLMENKLTDPPDFTSNSKLLLVVLNQNQIKNPPDFRSNPELISLEMTKNQLCEPPEIHLNPKLKVLDLSKNQLTQMPNIQNNKILEKINLSENPLNQNVSFDSNLMLENIRLFDCHQTMPPNLCKHTKLIFLDIGENELKNSPDVSCCPELEDLYLNKNQITTPPNLQNNPKLTTLDLSDNQLSAFPDISNKPNLELLDLSKNMLTELPDSILNLSKQCHVILGGNRFTVGYISAFEERLRQHREIYPNEGPHIDFVIMDDEEDEEEHSSLEEELELWSEEFEQISSPEKNAIREKPTLERLKLNEEEQETLAEFLHRVREIPDYNVTATGDNVIVLVEKFLQFACDNVEFRNAMLALMLEGVETCGDRILIFFIKIEGLYQFHCKPLTDEEFKQLAIRMQRFELVLKHANKVYEKLGGDKDRHNDQIEVQLHFLTELRVLLDLPFTMQEMAFRAYSRAKKEQILKAGEEIQAITDSELLKQSEYWRLRIEKEFPEAVSDLQNYFVEKIEEARQYFDLESGHSQFLEDHQDLGKLLKEAEERGFGKHYSDFSKFIDVKKKEAIVSLKN